jgi:hypothetical protein
MGSAYTPKTYVNFIPLAALVQQEFDSRTAAAPLQLSACPEHDREKYENGKHS